MPDHPTYETRAMTAGVFLARHLIRCIEAHSADTPPPEPGADVLEDDDSGDGIQHILDFSAVILGLRGTSGYEKRLLRFYQALAEMIARQGAELECVKGDRE